MVKQNNDVRAKILAHLEKEERNMAWLSRKTDIPYGSLYSIFIHRIMILSDSNLEKINKVLETNFINE